MLYEKIHDNGEKIAERHVKAFLDLLVLGILNGNSLYGYKIIAAVHKEFGVLLSPGSLYPLLHALESKMMVTSTCQSGKIVYAATPNGRRVFQSTFTDYRAAVQQLCSFMNSSSESTSQGL